MNFFVALNNFMVNLLYSKCYYFRLDDFTMSFIKMNLMNLRISLTFTNACILTFLYGKLKTVR